MHFSAHFFKCTVLTVGTIPPDVGKIVQLTEIESSILRGYI